MGIYQFKNLHTGMTPSQVTQMRSLEWLNFKSKCHSIELLYEFA
jgi:hypothetical protein